MSLVEHIPIVEPRHPVPRVQVEQDADDGGRQTDEGEREVPRVVVRLEALQLHYPGWQFNRLVPVCFGLPLLLELGKSLPMGIFPLMRGNI